MTEFLLMLAAKYPIILTIVSVIGVLRVIFKPLMMIIETIVAATPSKKDDEKFNKFKSSSTYAFIVKFLDFFASIKLPKPVKK